MRDIDVRQALWRKVLADHIRDPRTRVVSELGVAYGEARVDIAVVNGRLHGFEIKSDSGTLVRLPSQIEAYNRVFDRVTLVAGRKHIDGLTALIPDWWGVKIATSGIRNAVHFTDLRRASQNPDVEGASLAALLWRDEALAVLTSRGVKGIKSKTRPQLAALLANSLSLKELGQAVRDAIKARGDWRSDVRLKPRAGLSQPSATTLDCPDVDSLHTPQ
jgi:hypothetical protein